MHGVERILVWSTVFITLLSACGNAGTAVPPEEDSSDFVSVTDIVPDCILEIRYYSTYNFIGDRLPGQEAGAYRPINGEQYIKTLR